MAGVSSKMIAVLFGAAVLAACGSSSAGPGEQSLALEPAGEVVTGSTGGNDTSTTSPTKAPSAEASPSAAPTTAPTSEPTAAAPTPETARDPGTTPIVAQQSMAAAPICSDVEPEQPCIRLFYVSAIEGVYEAEWNAVNFTPSTGGMHAHFYWDIYEAAQAGTNAEDVGLERAPWELTADLLWRSADFSPSQVPAGATAICVTVADGNHAVVHPATEDCAPLLDVLAPEGAAGVMQIDRRYSVLADVCAFVGADGIQMNLFEATLNRADGDIGIVIGDTVLVETGAAQREFEWVPAALPLDASIAGRSEAGDMRFTLQNKPYPPCE